MTELWSLFQNNDGNIIHKWTHYFPAYEEHFSRFKNRSAVLVEIGVFKGGSLELWKKFLGPRVQVVGIDIEDKLEYEQDQIAIRQGGQSDPVFLQSVIDEFGPPDIIIDDGTHETEQVTTAFEFLCPRISPTSVYFVEDIHTAYCPGYGRGLRKAECPTPR
jgi:cephalosporin hydroxylase